MRTHASMPISVLAALISVQVLFGINYVVGKMIVSALPPLVWANIRIVVACAIMMSIAVLSRHKHPRGAKFFVPLIGLSALGIVINQSAFLLGLHYTTSTNSAILNTLIPVFTLLIVTLRGQEPLTPARAVGFLVAFSGVLAIRRVEDISFSDKTVIGDLLTMLNCFSYGCFLSFGKKFLEENDRIWTTAWLFAYGSVGITAIASPQWTTFHAPPVTPALLGCMAFAILGGTLATYFLNNWALARAHSSSVALFIYLQPIVAAFIAWEFLGTPITVRTVISTSLIFTGMIFVLLPQLRPATSRRKDGLARPLPPASG